MAHHRTQSPDVKPRVWIKADAKDIKVALLESQLGEWNGDVQLDAQSLQILRAEYDRRRNFMEHLQQCNEEEAFLTEQEVLIEDLNADDRFLVDAHGKALEVYHHKQAKGGIPQQRLMELHWDVTEHLQLLEQCQTLQRRVHPQLQLPWREQQDRFRNRIDEELRTYLKNLFKKKRTAASHVLVFMISTEKRNERPYAIPVMYVPCQVLRDQFERDLCTEITLKLQAKGIDVIGK